ncbi:MULTISPECIES: VgrG-related protein [Streptomyces]|uniref:VgrG-related protein n=1 Tax=Streptomyces caniscabiei TaxID=2746961 RepID=A0ABU4N1B1_9ACTN|nr:MULTISPECIES: VgrG-related protein [Streptomyces]MBE4735511.1 VgrG-related protein [Streptomyces caniscabiei]MBE4758124.1 VgrG-related protein [Streptomyces caniscabiei]MBE4774761.1 VgrG-related protein [Streptomyces caniscabiei]MBE4789519.1 VgrG-related protein [Streptomyces caniscabiei]MBE4795929.1 VgrG-related protein [Streptomyces caniscabiei]
MGGSQAGNPSFSNVIQVTVDGRQLPTDYADLLVGGWVDLGAGVPGAFRLTFRDPHGLLLGKLNVKFGSAVVISPVAGGQGAGNPVFTGEVTGMETDYDGTGTFTVVRGYDAGHRLMRVRRVAAYRNQTASDIARKLAAMNGVPVGQVQSTKTVYDFISQSNVTDWDFLARLADENEMVMSLDAKGKFQFVRPKPASGAPASSAPGRKNPFELKAGLDILRCRAAVTASDQVGKVEARGWNVTTKKKLTATTQADANPGIAIGTTPQKAASPFKAAKLVETDTPYDLQSEVTHAAGSLADDITSAFAELEVTVRGNPLLRPGVPITLSDVGAPFEGKYTCTSVRHTFGDGSHYETWVTVSGRQWRSLFGLTSGGGTAAPRLPSVANALVTDVQDPLKQGRVKLQFPWLDDAYVSDWTRTVQMGGKGGGGIFPLDVGDEVLVAFDRGALDHPFVIGGLYNGVDKPTPVKDVHLHDPVRKKAIRHTLSDREGNRVDLLSQQTGLRKQGVRLATGNDRLIINLDRTKTEITVDSKGAVSITGGTSVSVKAGTDLTLSARRSVTIRSGGPLNLQGQGIVGLRSLGGAVNVNAVGALTMSAAGAATISAAGTVQINAVGQAALRAANVDITGIVLVNKKPYPIP